RECLYSFALPRMNYARTLRDLRNRHRYRQNAHRRGADAWPEGRLLEAGAVRRGARNRYADFAPPHAAARRSLSARGLSFQKSAFAAPRRRVGKYRNRSGKARAARLQLSPADRGGGRADGAAHAPHAVRRSFRALAIAADPLRAHRAWH